MTLLPSRPSHVILLACVTVLASVVSTGVSADRGDPQQGNSQGRNSQARGGVAVGISLFAEPNFSGVNANFRTDVPDLRRFNMNDLVGSLQVARGEIWEVCENANYGGRCQVFSADEANLARISWGGMISSLRQLRDRPVANQPGGNRNPQGAGISLFAEPAFRGLNSNFRVDVADLRRFNMNDRVDSLQIARGEIWEVCENINYGGRCQVFSADEANLSRISWGGMISSLRQLRDANAARGFGRAGLSPFQARPRLVLFDEVGYRGNAFVVNQTTPMLRALGNRAGSAKVYEGAWELCDGDQFRGRCVTVTDSVADLARVGLRDRVSSARPARSLGRGQ